MSDYYNIIDSAEKRAREEGIAEGREEGRMEAMLQNAQKMKEIGIDADTIMQITGLDFDVVSTL